jgi:aspartokinase/homoserine dehydrogenase 1
MIMQGSASNWSVNKFGGTSVASAHCMGLVRDIVAGELEKGGSQRMAVVVSAMGGKPKVTDMLLSTVESAARGDRDTYPGVLTQIYEKHTTAIRELGLTWSQAESIVRSIDADIKDLKDILRAVALMRHNNEGVRELVSGYGEVWSSQILCALLQSSGMEFTFVNARRVIIVDERMGESGTDVAWKLSAENLEQVLSEISCTSSLVITGFIASTPDGVATTLKRDGSDYSASIFGKLLRADSINIWTDVDGVLSADPRRVPEAQVLSEVSFNEAMELAYFGAKVIHPKTMLPAVEANIPLYIKNTFRPTAPGTRIFRSSTATKDRLSCVCGFSTVDDIALLNIEGSGMIGVPGVAQRLFGALHSMGISVILISQASSEHSISVAIQASSGAAAKAGVEDTFDKELRLGLISRVDLLLSCCIVAAVGDGMSSTKNVAGTFFSALGKAGINVVAIAQGCSERNISCVVRSQDSARALRTVHAAFLLSRQTLGVGVIGCETPVGQALLGVIGSQVGALQQRFNCCLQLLALAESPLGEPPPSPSDPGAAPQMVLNPACSSSSWSPALDVSTSTPINLDAFATHMKPYHTPYSIIIDCTSERSVARRHVEWLGDGIHVISHNAHATGGSLEDYHALLSQRVLGLSSYNYESTVGGGLPVLVTLQNLQSAGDTIYRVEGVISACMSMLFNGMFPPTVDSEAPPLSLGGACKRAADAGILSKRNPGPQLLAEDLRMRLLTLGRELGLELHEADVQVEQLVSPAKAAAMSESSDWDSLLRDESEALFARAARAAERGCVLRYLAVVDVESGSASARIQEVLVDDRLAHLKGGTFCVNYVTERLEDIPLTVQGPVGGPSLTASAIFSDLIRVARDTGCRDRGHRHLMRSYSFPKNLGEAAE